MLSLLGAPGKHGLDTNAVALLDSWFLSKLFLVLSVRAVSLIPKRLRTAPADGGTCELIPIPGREGGLAPIGALKGFPSNWLDRCRSHDKPGASA